MNTVDQKIAILIFAHSAEVESERKKIAEGHLLFNALTDHALNEVKKTKLPYFHFTEEQQSGLTFGNRFGNAIHAIFNRGFHQVIAIGNDTPHLKAAHIRKAAKALLLGQNVLGPSVDGGFYLLGLQKQHFEKDSFAALPWQSGTLYSSILSHLEPKSTTYHLETLIDIDSAQELKLAFHQRKPLTNTLRSLLKDLLSSRRLAIFGSSLHLQHSYSATPNSVRGSPVLLS